MPKLNHILEACKRGDRLAQKALYTQYKNKLFVLCLRYADNRSDAEDILQEGFIRIFGDLHQFRGEGSLEGWMRKVVLRIALQHIRKQRQLQLTPDFEKWEQVLVNDEEPEVDMEMVKRLLHLMQKMPAGFRTVLNLYIMEGYTHPQIANELGISVGTSKSQLNRAKKYLKNMIEKSLLE